MERKIFLCLLMIMILSMTGCSLSNASAKNSEYTVFNCDIENNNIRVSEEGNYSENFDLKQMQLYNRDENVIAYVKNTQELKNEANYLYEIYIEDELKYILKEIKDTFGRHFYEISNEKSEFLAQINLEKNVIEIKDIEENLIADCQILDTNQYLIKIYRHNIDKKAIVMLSSRFRGEWLLKK